MISSVPAERIRLLHDTGSFRGRYVLYWMHTAHRTGENPALQYAIERANHLHLPCVTYFSLWREYPESNLRHFRFMLEGLAEVASQLESMGIRFILRIGPPNEGFPEVAEDAAVAVIDRGYLAIHRQWYRYITARCPCSLIQVEGNAIVPVEVASQKEEYSAATFRPRIWRQAERFLRPLKPVLPEHSSTSWDIPGLAGEPVDELLSKLDLDPRVPPSREYVGGPSEASKRYTHFLEEDLNRYADSRNDPVNPAISHMSPYLHFGQVSPVTLARGALEGGGPDSEAFMEELLVRRELSLNFVHYNPRYDSFSCLPSWAMSTLKRHASDPRTYLYTLDELEQAQTHDSCWNAAQNEMVSTGKMQGYLRMYWGKKILEWSATPQEAYRCALYLNNAYELDGRDPNGYAGVAWCFGKHDRPWKERKIFGTVRYMGEAGLRKKFDMGPYVQKYLAFRNG